MAVELEYFRLFYEIAKQSNISKAAEALHLSQPTATIELRRLEDQLGVTLFTRHSRGVKLTSEGEYFFQRLSPIMSSLLELEAEIEDIGKLKSGVIRISFNNTQTLHSFSPYLDDFQDLFPDILIQRSILPRSSVLSALNHGSIDFSFAGRPGDEPRPAIRHLPGIMQTKAGPVREFSIGNFKDQILSNLNIKELSGDNVSIKDVIRYTVIAPAEPDNRRLDYYLALAQRADNKNINFLHMDNIDTILQFLSSEKYVGIIPGLYSARRPLSHSIRKINMAEPLMSTEYLMHYSADRQLGMAASRLLKYITECKEFDLQELPCSI